MLRLIALEHGSWPLLTCKSFMDDRLVITMSYLGFRMSSFSIHVGGGFQHAKMVLRLMALVGLSTFPPLAAKGLVSIA